MEVGRRQNSLAAMARMLGAVEVPQQHSVETDFALAFTVGVPLLPPLGAEFHLRFTSPAVAGRFAGLELWRQSTQGFWVINASLDATGFACVEQTTMGGTVTDVLPQAVLLSNDEMSTPILVDQLMLATAPPDEGFLCNLNDQVNAGTRVLHRILGNETLQKFAGGPIWIPGARGSSAGGIFKLISNTVNTAISGSIRVGFTVA